MLVAWQKMIQETVQVQSPEPSGTESMGQDGQGRVPPRTAAVQRGHGLLRRTTKADKPVEARPRAFPLPPDHTAQAAPKPEVEGSEDAFARARREVLHPPPQDQIQLLPNEARHIAATPHMKQLLHTRAKPVQRLRGQMKPHVPEDLEERETEERPLPRTGNGALRVVHLQLQPLDILSNGVQDPVPSTASTNVNLTVIGIATEAVAPSFQFLVEVVKQDIGQQRRQRPALRSAFDRRTKAVGTQDTRSQVGVDQPLQALIRHFPTDAGHQNVMVHFVKELLQVQINHPLATVLLVGQGLMHGIMRTAPGTKAVTELRESGIEYRSQHLTNGLLDQPIHHGGNAQMAHPAARLG